MGNVVFTKDDWQKLEDYTALCPVEIACMGYATLQDGNVVVSEVFLVPQVISLSSVDFLSRGFPWAVKKAAKEDRLNELRFCWHSHATHGAYFSPTDEDMVRKVRDAGPIPWFASCVLNKKGETHAQLDYFRSSDEELAAFSKHITIELDVQVEGQDDRYIDRLVEMEEFTELKSEYDKKKKSKKPTKPRDAVLPLEAIHESEDDKEWTPVITGRDWRLHNEARNKGWESYVKDDVAYYWDDETREFKGSAPIPIDENGEYKIDIDPSVIDATAEDDTNAELVPIDEAEEALLEQAQSAGLL